MGNINYITTHKTFFTAILIFDSPIAELLAVESAVTKEISISADIIPLMTSTGISMNPGAFSITSSIIRANPIVTSVMIDWGEGEGGGGGGGGGGVEIGEIICRERIAENEIKRTKQTLFFKTGMQDYIEGKKLTIWISNGHYGCHGNQV